MFIKAKIWNNYELQAMNYEKVGFLPFTNGKKQPYPICF